MNNLHPNIINLENVLIYYIQHELGVDLPNIEEEENPYKRRVTKEYLDNLEAVTDVDDKICNICLDTIKKDEECIKLPCKDSGHYFHKNDTEMCGGIMKWLNSNSTCPCCRHEFPSEEYKIDNGDGDEGEDEDEDEDEDELNNEILGPGGANFLLMQNPFINFINEVRERDDIQRAIELSLQD
jgi:hypothetical protein